MATIAVIGEGYLAEITERYLKWLLPNDELIKVKTIAQREFDYGVICLKVKRHKTGSVDLREITNLMGRNKHLCKKKHFFIRTQMSVGYTQMLNYRSFKGVTLSYFPNFHKRDTDFSKIQPVVSTPRMHPEACAKKLAEFFGNKAYSAFEHETLELAAQMRYAINAIQAMSFHVLNELCVARDINYRAAITATIYAAEQHGEFTIYGAESHSAYGEWMATLRDLSRHAEREQVLGRALLDVVDGLNEQYFNQ